MIVFGAPVSLWGAERSIQLPRSRACNVIPQNPSLSEDTWNKGALDYPLRPALFCNHFSFQSTSPQISQASNNSGWVGTG